MNQDEKIKYSGTFSLELKMSEFYEFAKPLVDENILKESIKSELYHCWNGIINGDWGGDALDWKKVFYHQLFKDGIIEQTKTSIEWYGNFKLKSKS